MNNKLFYVSIAAVIALAILGILFLPKGSGLKEKAVLSLFTDKESFKAEEEMRVNVFLDTGGLEIDGADIVLRYDFEHILPFDEQSLLEKSGSIFQNFMGPLIDKEAGIIKFSALSFEGEKFKGKGKIASMLFTAKKEGNSEMEFVFYPGQTTDSNVSLYEAGKDVLGKAENLSISILPR